MEKRFVSTTATSDTVTLVFAAEKGGIFRVSVPIQKNRRKRPKK